MARSYQIPVMSPTARVRPCTAAVRICDSLRICPLADASTTRCVPTAVGVNGTSKRYDTIESLKHGASVGTGSMRITTPCINRLACPSKVGCINGQPNKYWPEITIVLARLGTSTSGTTLMIGVSGGGNAVVVVLTLPSPPFTPSSV